MDRRAVAAAQPLRTAAANSDHGRRRRASAWPVPLIRPEQYMPAPPQSFGPVLAPKNPPPRPREVSVNE